MGGIIDVKKMSEISSAHILLIFLWLFDFFVTGLNCLISFGSKIFIVHSKSIKLESWIWKRDSGDKLRR